jgi:hypothetical protein
MFLETMNCFPYRTILSRCMSPRARDDVGIRKTREKHELASSYE